MRVSSTHWPIDTIRLLSSATGMNSIGDTSPSSGDCQRSSASMPLTRPSARSTWGW